MISLRLLLVFTFAMCADKNLAMKNSNENNENEYSCEESKYFQDTKKNLLKNLKEAELLGGALFIFLNRTPWVNGILWCFYHIAPKIGGGREKNEWGWEGYWGKGVYGFFSQTFIRING